jgi:hypothetical protein
VAFRPLSQRENPDPKFDGPHDGIPSWMYQSVGRWIDELIYVDRGNTRAPSEQLLQLAETLLHVTFDWSGGPFTARASLLHLVGRDGEFGLNFLDFLLALRLKLLPT